MEVFSFESCYISCVVNLCDVKGGFPLKVAYYLILAHYKGMEYLVARYLVHNIWYQHKMILGFGSFKPVILVFYSLVILVRFWGLKVGVLGEDRMGNIFSIFQVLICYNIEDTFSRSYGLCLVKKSYLK